MTRFSVWAPNANAVSLAVVPANGVKRQRAEMRQDGNMFVLDLDVPVGEGEGEGEGEGTRYGFSLDGGRVLPDPRSPSQPEGVHELSATVDHEEFTWTDGDWPGVEMHDAVIYEMHIGTFTPGGTFESAIERLDYLRELGISLVEVMPIAEFPGNNGWGYDGVDLFAPHHAYGGPEGFKRFVDACHAHGIGVLLDVVYNHLGPDGNYLPMFGPYFTETHRTLWGQAVNYDAEGSYEVRRFVIDNAMMWLRDYHCDGLRLDAVHAIINTSDPHLLKEIANVAHAMHPRRLVIAEDRDARRKIVDDTGYSLDGVWNDAFHHALHVRLTGETAGYYGGFTQANSLAQALLRADVSPEQLVVCSQNHDQIGNRALGERLSALVNADRLRIAAALTILGSFTPLLFQGEEWAATTPFQYFTDHTDVELSRGVEEGRRREFASFGWAQALPSPQDAATFAASKLDWTKQDAQMLDWYSALIALRRGDHVEIREDDGVFKVSREHVRLTVNLSKRTHTEKLEDGWMPALTSNVEAVDGNLLSIRPDGVVVAVRGVENRGMSQQRKSPDLFDSDTEDPAGDPPTGTYIAPDEPMGSHSHGTTAAEARRGETIADRQRHTEPEDLKDSDADHLGSLVQQGDEDVDEPDADEAMLARVENDEGDLSAEESAMHTTNYP